MPPCPRPRPCPSWPVFCVGRVWSLLQQQCHSHRSSPIQHGSGSVQPPSHCSCPLCLCCAPCRSVSALQAETKRPVTGLLVHLFCSLYTSSDLCVFFLLPGNTAGTVWIGTQEGRCDPVRMQDAWQKNNLRMLENKTKLLSLLFKYTCSSGLGRQETLSAHGLPVRRCLLAHVSLGFCDSGNVIYLVIVQFYSHELAAVSTATPSVVSSQG